MVYDVGQNMNRVQTATDAIQRHLRILGYPESSIQVLKNSNHVTASVSDMVVRVLVHGGEVSQRRMAREIEVCHFLTEQGAPTTQPTERFNPGPYQIDDCVLSYWKRENERAEDNKDT